MAPLGSLTFAALTMRVVLSRSNSPKRGKRPETRKQMTPILGYCHETGKRMYENKSVASRALKDVNRRLMQIPKSRRGRSEALQARVYECEFCGSWHTTSQSR